MLYKTAQAFAREALFIEPSSEESKNKYCFVHVVYFTYSWNRSQCYNLDISKYLQYSLQEREGLVPLVVANLQCSHLTGSVASIFRLDCLK